MIGLRLGKIIGLRVGQRIGLGPRIRLERGH